MTIPYTFANLPGPIPLSDLDANFSYVGNSANTTYTQGSSGSVTRTVQAKLQESISVKDFGAKGDGVTDDTAAIQAAFDWAVYQNSSSGTGLGSVYIPAGNYLVSNTLQMGYGNVYNSLQVFGSGAPVGGTIITANFNDRPVFAVNGGRSCSIKNLSILGKNLNWINSHNLGYGSRATIDELVASNWVDTSFPASASSQYAPYCAIAIDPYAGSQPTVHYPNVTFPSWSGITTQYGKNYSSDTLIENVQIFGFVVGIVNQPNADGNGDFTKLLQCIINQCQYALSIGNTQSRLVRVSNCGLQQNYTGITTSNNGVKLGNPSIYVDNTAFDSNINWIYCPTGSYGGVASFTNCYAEGMYSIGTFTAGGASQTPLSFSNCSFAFSWNDGNYRGIPLYMLASSVFTSFDSCKFYDDNNTANILPFSCYPSQMSLRNISLNNIGSYATKLYEKFPINSCRGISVGRNESNCNNFTVYGYNVYDLNTGALNSSSVITNSNSIDYYSRQYCLPFQTNFYAQIISTGPFSKVNTFTGFYFYDKTASGCTISVTGRTVVFSYATGVTQAFLNQFGGTVGDLVVSTQTGIVYFISSITGVTVTLIAQSGFNASGNLLATESLVGYFVAKNCRLFAFKFVTLGNYTSSNPVISNVATSFGDSSSINSVNNGVQVSDSLCIDENNSIGYNQITAIDTTAQTITLNSNLNYSQSRVKLGLFIRPSPANNT